MDNNSYFITNNNNHIRITKKYFDDIFLPTLKMVNKKINPMTKSYNIAGKVVNLNFYGKDIFNQINKAICHNEINLNKNPEMNIHLFDSTSTGVDMVSFYDKSEYILKKEDVSSTLISDNFLGIYINGEGTINFYDEEKNEAYFWINDINNIPFWIVAAPLRTIFHWFLSKHNTHLVHGAVVGLNNKSILITAKGGSGKSTTALSCLLNGMNYIGDDYVILGLDDKVKTYSLFNSVKVLPDSLNIFPELKDNVWNKNKENDKEGKSIIFLSDLFPKKLSESLFLEAIFIPIIKNTSKTKIIKASKLQAMLAIIPTTFFQLSITTTNKMMELKSIIEKTPCYFLELGSDPREVSDVIKSFLLYESR